ncbi:HAD family phosphatase [Rhodococcus spelaei]|uniref:HAD family phosphatase n=1 Tax=Rhodococcus spelaei TaxID=2546320 RepID=A0A541BNN9_9NOCA|nr:HAD hydrolase family protein [Rhodococcus spelaei]TQF73955.1 HAD family phosphatase [Rhodococcus spelaei]
MTATVSPQVNVPTAPLQAANLLCTGEMVADRLQEALRRRDWLDAFLLAAGLVQLIEDRLHPDPMQLRRAASYMRAHGSAPARAAGALASACATVLSRPAQRRTLIEIRNALAALTSALAALVLDPDAVTSVEPDSLPPIPPGAFGLDVIRLPACFTSFDQHPDDARWMARTYLDQYPDRGAPIAVVGVRTSGDYLAPLQAAALEAAGVTRVEVLSYRPGQPFLRTDEWRLRDIARSGGRVLITDDPPGSGGSLAAAATAVGAAGVPDSSIVLLIPLFADTEDPPVALFRWPAVTQPWTEWSVHQRLTPDSVGRALTRLLGADWQVQLPRPRPLPPSIRPRGHVRCRFLVRVVNRSTGQTEDRDILVEGAGLGYLGRHSIAVAEGLDGHLPRVYGFDDGLLYRDWLPSAGRPPTEQAVIRAIVDYVTERSKKLAVRTDPTPRLRGRAPAWEVAAELLAKMYGPLAPPAQLCLLEPVVRRLMFAAETNVVDGKTDTRHWLADPAADGLLRKVDFHDRAFSNLELVCYDPVFDLAGAAADPPSAAFGARLRAAYEHTTGQHVDGERWLLYRLGQLWRLDRTGEVPAARMARQSAAAVHDYLADLYLADLRPTSGPLCAIDLDGVLESDPLGFPATTPAGVLALRALTSHGYRPVLVTGRSLVDARDRCVSFGLAGAVAEYGAVCYRRESGTVTDLRRTDQRAMLDRIRAALGRHPDVQIDPDYQYIVRARLRDGPLPNGLLDQIPESADPAVRVIHGQGQTDLIVEGIDKGAGLRALAGELSASECALAVGDSAPDLAMFDLAALARAPRNADRAVRFAGIPLTRRAYQSGLAEACADLLGHRPGGCPTCRTPALAPRSTVLLTVLGLREDDLRALTTRTARLVALTLGRSRW